MGGVRFSFGRETINPCKEKRTLKTTAQTGTKPDSYKVQNVSIEVVIYSGLKLFIKVRLQ